MFSSAKQVLKAALPENITSFLIHIKNTYFDGYALNCYSQEGEDMILRRLFEKQTAGFYVDVGAHHPKRFSNTYFFYKQGWRGINIDAMPGSMKLFDKLRPRDINLEKAVSDKRETSIYYVFNEPALSGFSEEISDKRDGAGDYHVICKKQLVTCTLKEILDAHLPDGQTIDFLSVDVEGLDMKVLRSNDWQRHKPRVVLVEMLGLTLEEVFKSEVHAFLHAKGYLLFAKAVNTFFFKMDD